MKNPGAQQIFILSISRTVGRKIEISRRCDNFLKKLTEIYCKFWIFKKYCKKYCDSQKVLQLKVLSDFPLAKSSQYETHRKHFRSVIKN